MGRCGLSAPWEVTNLPKIIDRKLCGGFLGRKLGDDDGDEDNEAAEKLSCAQRLMEDKPAEEDSEDRFQAQDHAGKRGGDELLAKDALFADFKAVKEGNVWCTGKSFYQATDIVGEMIRDIHHVLTDGDESAMTFLTKVS